MWSTKSFRPLTHAIHSARKEDICVAQLFMSLVSVCLEYSGCVCVRKGVRGEIFLLDHLKVFVSAYLQVPRGRFR